MAPHLPGVAPVEGIVGTVARFPLSTDADPNGARPVSGRWHPPVPGQPTGPIPPNPDEVVTVSAEVSNLTDHTFDETLTSSAEPVLVDFWAEWCGPCKMVAPILDELATEQAGKLKVAKLNVDENPGSAQRYGVMSIPTMILFKDGAEAERLVGARGKNQILEALSSYM